MPIAIEPASLKEALARMTVDSLQKIMRAVALPTPRPTRKAEIVAALLRTLDEGCFRELWPRLDDLQQFAVSDALYGSRRFDEQRFLAHHGRLPEGYAWENRPRPSLLPVFLYPVERGEARPTYIPRDLADILLKFVPRPPEPVLEGADECPEFVQRPLHRWPSRGKKRELKQVPLVRRDMEVAAVQDLFAVLRLVERGRLFVGPKTGRPAAKTVELLVETLHGGDFFESQASDRSRRGSRPKPIGHVRAFAWPLLIQAAGLAERVRGKLALTRAGRKAIAEEPAVTLRRVWTRWQTNTLLDEFSRIESVKGQTRGRGKRAMTATQERRLMIVEALEESPVGRWVAPDEFLLFMHATDRDFRVTSSPYSLYLGSPEYGSFADDDGQIELEMRYLLCFLFEYAATLGLVDVAYTAPRHARLDFASRWGADDLDCLSRYDGLEYFRLTPLGAFCLGLTKRYSPSKPPAPSALMLLPDLRVRAAAPLQPAERLLLELYAVGEAENVWRLDMDRALSAIESDHDPAEFREFLAARDDQPLPEKVESFLRHIERDARALRPGVLSLLIECADAETADRIAANPQAAKHCTRAGPSHLVVPARSEDRFRKAVHVLGYALPPRRSG